MAAIEIDDMTLLSEPRLGERYAHAAAIMALYADTPSLVAYRRLICPRIDDLPECLRPTQGDFEKALWEKQWSSSGTPGEVTYREALRNRRVRENDGRYNTRQRLDRTATAEVLDDIPEEKPASLSEKQIAQFRQQLRALGVRAGLKSDQVDFLVGMALEGKQQKDNPTAWRAIRGRKRKSLIAGVTELLEKLRR